MPYTPNYAAGDVLTAAAMNSIGEAYTTYTPTWSTYLGTTSLGNGTLTGRYCVLNKIVFGHIKLTWGSTTTVTGAGANNAFLFSTPSGYDVSSNFPVRTAIGTAVVEDSATTFYSGIVAVTSSTTMGVFSGLTATDYISKIFPFPWGNTDAVTFTFCYERA